MKAQAHLQALQRCGRRVGGWSQVKPRGSVHLLLFERKYISFQSEYSGMHFCNLVRFSSSLDIPKKIS